MKEFKGAIFDLDGTLIDSMGVWETIDIKFLEKRNISLPKDYIEKINPNAIVNVYGQELLDESFAICQADMLMKGQNPDNRK